MASIRDVAADAGVSIATVSRVLHPDPRNKISPATREAVLAAMRRLQYEPRPSGRAAGAAPFRAGCILNSVLPKFSDRFYTTILTAFEAQIARLGGEIGFLRTAREIEEARGRLGGMLEGIDFVLTMEYLADGLLAEIRRNTRGVAGVDIEDARLDRVGYDRLHAAAQAADYLLARGHRRIAYIGGSEGAASRAVGGGVLHARIDDERYVGYCCRLRMEGVAPLEELARDCGWSREKCEEATRALMALPQPPTAILAASDNMAIAAISACGRMGLRVPRDVSVMGISDIEEAQFSNPPLTTVRVPQAEIGREAARLLVGGAVAGAPARLVLLPTGVVERDSVADA